jgi:hypothetical protein
MDLKITLQKEHLGELVVDERIVLHWIFDKEGVKV